MCANLQEFRVRSQLEQASCWNERSTFSVVLKRQPQCTHGIAVASEEKVSAFLYIDLHSRKYAKSIDIVVFVLVLVRAIQLIVNVKEIACIEVLCQRDRVESFAPRSRDDRLKVWHRKLHAFCQYEDVLPSGR